MWTASVRSYEGISGYPPSPMSGGSCDSEGLIIHHRLRHNPICVERQGEHSGGHDAPATDTGVHSTEVLLTWHACLERGRTGPCQLNPDLHHIKSLAWAYWKEILLTESTDYPVRGTLSIPRGSRLVHWSSCVTTCDVANSTGYISLPKPHVISKLIGTRTFNEPLRGKLLFTVSHVASSFWFSFLPRVFHQKGA